MSAATKASHMASTIPRHRRSRPHEIPDRRGHRDAPPRPGARLALFHGADPAGARRRRRRDAADQFRPVDHRMEADPRRHPALEPRRMAGGIRQVPADSRIRGDQQGHEPRPVQGDLLVGMGAPPAGAHRRAFLRAAARLLLGDGTARPAPQGAACRHPCARRPAGLHRLVDGVVRPVGTHRCQPLPARGPSDDGEPDHRRRSWRSPVRSRRTRPT